jgi:2-phosphoglycolate phosphatase
MAIDAVMFDFDGTLADSFGAITASVNDVRRRFGHPPLAEVTVKEYVGYGLTNLVERLVPGVDPAAAVAAYREHHTQVMITGTRLFPGVIQTLEGLHARTIPMAVCSNKSVHFTKQLVEGLGLGVYFAAVLGPEDVVAPKPHPAMLLEGAKRLKVSPERCVYVGDMIVDVQTAKAAGMPVWIVPFGVYEDTASVAPDRRLESFLEILALV